MVLFEFVIALLLAGALLFVWSRRAGVPYPALLSLAGAAAALIPGIPVVTLESELALVLFVAPTLLDAAYDASPRDMRNNWLPIGALAIVVVGLTVAAVAVVARALVPAMPWTAAIALGAIVAPPDASAATAVLRRQGNRTNSARAKSKPREASPFDIGPIEPVGTGHGRSLDPGSPGAPR